MNAQIKTLKAEVLADDELRRFRHLFRSAYRLRIDADRLALVHKKAKALQKVYPADLEHFLTFLDTL